MLTLGVGMVFPLAAQSTEDRSNRQASMISYRKLVIPGPRVEAGFSLAAANAMTDIASSNANAQSAITDIYLQGTSPSASVWRRYRYNDRYAVKTNLSWIHLRGKDSWSSNQEVAQRGKSFSNNLFELSFLGEYYIPKKYTRTKQDFSVNWSDLYLFTGLAVFYHDPVVKGPVIDTYDEVLLNNPDAYSNLQLAIPLGVGYAWNFSNRWTLGLDTKFRFTFFDFVDGFKRPYSTRYDYYFTLNANLGFVLDSKDSPNNRGIAKKVFKPKKKN